MIVDLNYISKLSSYHTVNIGHETVNVCTAVVAV